MILTQGLRTTHVNARPGPGHGSGLPSHWAPRLGPGGARLGSAPMAGSPARAPFLPCMGTYSGFRPGQSGLRETFLRGSVCRAGRPVRAAAGTKAVRTSFGTCYTTEQRKIPASAYGTGKWRVRWLIWLFCSGNFRTLPQPEEAHLRLISFAFVMQMSHGSSLRRSNPLP